MKIALVHPNLAVRGGAENVVVWLAQSLARRGHRVIVLTASYRPELWPEEQVRGLQVEILRAPLAFLRSKRLTLHSFGRSLARRVADCDVLNCHNWPSNLWVARARRASRRFPRVVWYCQEPNRRIYWEETDRNLVRFAAAGGDLRYNEHLRRDVERERASAALRARKRARDIAWDQAALQAVDQALVNSRFSQAAFERVYRRAAAICALGIPLPDEREPACERGVGFCAVSPLTRKKNVHNVIEAFGLLAGEERLGQARLRIVGDGAERPLLERRVAELGLTGRVEFLGFVPDAELRRVYREARLLVYVPVDEPFGLVPLEAMASGTPVVASDHGGPLESVVHGETGLHVNPFDPRAIAEAVASLYHDEARRREMGTAGVRRVREQFSLESFLDRFERLALTGTATEGPVPQ
ncbi:MAG TPA: glycosyltransferase family 4 protein [Planctomycetota bacterium]|nr:glycosyltransferase family 4 protein [Planctomycetota bacterium]HRR79297.1 glycosyltransferase family 4 protein [Planctomycetota bacterium]HRT96502.1 glycosyltransferase family 4 protein [Planctomycetota bacterium]